MKAERKETMIRNWYKFSSGGVSVIGLAIVVLIIVLAIFAPVIAPYPQDVGAVVNFEEVLWLQAWNILWEPIPWDGMYFRDC